MTSTWCVHLHDLRRIVQGGAVRASTFAMTALMTLLLNALVASRFDGDCLLILVLVEQIVGFSTVFLGMSCAIRPVIGTLRGEGNTKAARQLMLTAAKDMILSGALVSALVAAFAPYLVEVFGIRDVALFHEAVSAVRITSTALFLYAPMTLFFNYYSFIEKNLPALFLSSLKDFLCPLVCVMFAVTISKSHVGLWYALAFASVLAGITFALLILKTYGREQFPFLIPTDRDNVIFIYDFELNVPNVSALLEEADQILCEHHYPLKTRNSLRLYLEETLLMMEEINTGKRVKVECNIVCEETGVRIILRDSGRIMDLTDPDAEVSSLRQYILSNMMAAMQQKTEYMVTTGYNRHELFLTATAGDGDR